MPERGPTPPGAYAASRPGTHSPQGGQHARGGWVAAASTSREDRRAGLIVTSTADSGAGSLRAAIENANRDDDRDRISFALPGDRVRTMRLESPLPDITKPLAIDGYSQRGSSMNTDAWTSNAVRARSAGRRRAHRHRHQDPRRQRADAADAFDRRGLALLARRVVPSARVRKRAWLTPTRVAQPVIAAGARDARTGSADCGCNSRMPSARSGTGP